MSRVSRAGLFPIRRFITVLGLLGVVAALSFSCRLGPARTRDGATSDKQKSPLILHVDGRDRRYYVHVPPGLDPQQPAPLVIVLHGGGAKATSMVKGSSISAIADREKFVVVYPEAVDRRWNYGWMGDSSKDRNPENVDDIKFISNLIDHVASERNIDPRRIYATGISRGGMMCYRLACELSNRIAAISPVAGSLPVELKDCKPPRPVPVLAIHGTDDPIVPYAGGTTRVLWKRLGDVVSAEDSARTFARLNGCSDNPTLAAPIDRNPDDGTRMIRMSYADCREGASVELLTVEGGGHTWPSGSQYLSPRLIGRVTQEIDADVIWEFFRAHPMSRVPTPA